MSASSSVLFLSPGGFGLVFLAVLRMVFLGSSCVAGVGLLLCSCGELEDDGWEVGNGGCCGV